MFQEIKIWKFFTSSKKHVHVSIHKSLKVLRNTYDLSVA